MKKIRLLIVDDSALIRTMLTSIFDASDDIEVVGTAADPIIARDKIKKLHPDVLTLDIEMPRMDGLTFLRNLMRLRPMPVIMISTLTEKGAEVTLEALKIGAVDFIAKPKVDVSNTLQSYADELVEKVKAAAAANIHVETKPKPKPKVKLKAAAANKSNSVDTIIQPAVINNTITRTEKIIALGSSTGGTEAVKELVKGLPATTPAILISQHLPVAFSASFANHVDEVTDMHAFVAKDGQEIVAGNIYISPGDRHILLKRQGNKYFCKLSDGPLVNRHKPSVEVMFRSFAQVAGSNALGVMLTGMGADGAVAMKEMCDAGSINIIQDEESCVVWGMPGAAYREGAVHYVLPLDEIAAQITKLAK